jgi:hypothetical protein
MRRSIFALVQQPPELADARFVAERSCLRAAGWDIPPVVPTATKSALSVTGVAGLVPSTADARTAGFSSTVRDTPDPITAYEQRLPGKKRAEFEAARNGPKDGNVATITMMRGGEVSRPASGCSAEALTAVYGSVETSLYLDNFFNEVIAQDPSSDAARVVRKDMPRYTTCMAEAGYRVTDLNAGELARKEFGKYREPGDPPKAAEARMAVTDARCQDKAGMIKDTNDLFFRKAGNWVTEHEAQILGWKEDLDASTRRAKQIIEHG